MHTKSETLHRIFGDAPGGVHRGGAFRKRELRLSPSPMAHSLVTFLAKQESNAAGRHKQNVPPHPSALRASTFPQGKALENRRYNVPAVLY